ncbi:MAG: hypothetical protein AAGC54_01990 [Cyanobacteria bacterium P01_F01_bin.4]
MTLSNEYLTKDTADLQGIPASVNEAFKNEIFKNEAFNLTELKSQVLAKYAVAEPWLRARMPASFLEAVKAGPDMAQRVWVNLQGRSPQYLALAAVTCLLLIGVIAVVTLSAPILYLILKGTALVCIGIALSKLIKAAVDFASDYVRAWLSPTDVDA